LVLTADTPILFGGGPQTEIIHQMPTVIETRLHPTCIEIIKACVDTELIREIVDHCYGRLLPIPQESSRLAHRAKLNGEAQLVLRPPAEFAFQTICRIQCEVTDQAILVRRYAQKRCRFGRPDKPSSTHSRSPLAH
tara:strand:+ start:3207 stop:3614 length:408 start_codon:yes stop_codon:yes gene_type:complete